VVRSSTANFDPMGVHTGDSITVAPAQTLTDRCYQAMRDAAFRVMRTVRVEAGGSNIQFAVHPDTGEMRVIEMNPRVSRSSALASKATGFPIAKISAMLAAGLTLDEIPNDITQVTPACFEPSLDYCVVKIPRWAFDKFKVADRRLGTRMTSVVEIRQKDAEAAWGNGLLIQAKRMGFSDRHLAARLASSEMEIRRRRLENGISPVMKAVDTCGAEFIAQTPYFYSSYEEETEVP